MERGPYEPDAKKGKAKEEDGKRLALFLRRGLELGASFSKHPGNLNLFSLFSQLSNDGADAFFIHRAESGDGKAQRDKALFFGDPDPFGDEIGEEAAVGAAGNFKTDPLLFFRNPAQGVGAARFGPSSSDDTCSRHKNFQFKLSADHSKEEGFRLFLLHLITQGKVVSLLATCEDKFAVRGNFILEDGRGEEVDDLLLDEPFERASSKDGIIPFCCEMLDDSWIPIEPDVPLLQSICDSFKLQSDDLFNFGKLQWQKGQNLVDPI